MNELNLPYVYGNYFIGDGRNDSPGHCAQYCTYTLMDCECKSIVSTITVDKRETSLKSPCRSWSLEVTGMNCESVDDNSRQTRNKREVCKHGEVGTAEEFGGAERQTGDIGARH